MQLKLPFFPTGCTMVSECLGVYEKEELVQYIVNGLPVYAHSKDDLKAFRYITSNFIHQGLCRKTEVERCFHVSEDGVLRAYKKFVEKGETGFFGDDARKGTAHKITGERRLRIQSKLDKGQSVNSIAKQEGVRESAITHYYGLESVVLTLAFMALGPIKNPEQFKQCKPGEIGKIIGLDRIPEVRCLREKINLLTAQNQAKELNRRTTLFDTKENQIKRYAWSNPLQ